MAALTNVVLAFLALTLAVCSSACLRTCRFRLCRPSKISLSSESDVPLTSTICLNNRPVGVVNTGEPRVQTDSEGYLPISQLDLRGLRRGFSSSFFKTYALPPSRSGANRGSGVGHEAPQENQRDFLGGRCVALPIIEYQKLLGGLVIENIRLSGRPLVECVSFMVEGNGRVSGNIATKEPSTEPSTEPLMEPSSEPLTETSTEPSMVLIII